MAITTSGGVYTLKDKHGVVRRTGRSNNLRRRSRKHGKAFPHLRFSVAHVSDSYAVQRGLEHRLYTKYRKTALPQFGGYNMTPALRKNHPQRARYMLAAANFLDPNARRLRKKAMLARKKRALVKKARAEQLRKKRLDEQTSDRNARAKKRLERFG